MNSTEFGNALKEYLDAHGIKYTYAADKMGWSRQLFHAKMLGDSKWKLDEVSKAMKLFGLPKDILM